MWLRTMLNSKIKLPSALQHIVMDIPSLQTNFSVKLINSKNII
jgi:hypothetical protein